MGKRETPHNHPSVLYQADWACGSGLQNPGKPGNLCRHGVGYKASQRGRQKLLGIIMFRPCSFIRVPATPEIPCLPDILLVPDFGFLSAIRFKSPYLESFEMLLTSVFGSVALLAGGAAAHGAVTSYIIAGKTYPGSAFPFFVGRIGKWLTSITSDL